MVQTHCRPITVSSTKQCVLMVPMNPLNHFAATLRITLQKACKKLAKSLQKSFHCL